MKKSLFIFAAAGILAMTPLTAYAEATRPYFEVPTSSELYVAPAKQPAYELGYTQEELNYLNTYGRGSGTNFLIHTNEPTHRWLDETLVMKAVGLDTIDFYAPDVSKVNSEVNYTLSFMINVSDGKGNLTAESMYYDIVSPLVLHDNNVITVKLSKRPYYDTILTIRYDLNNNYVTMRTEDNPDKITNVTVEATKTVTTGGDLNPTAQELAIAAERVNLVKDVNKDFYNAVGSSGWLSGPHKSQFDSDQSYDTTTRFVAKVMLEKEWGYLLTSYDYNIMEVVSQEKSSEKDILTMKTEMVPEKVFKLVIDHTNKVIIIRAFDA